MAGPPVRSSVRSPVGPTPWGPGGPGFAAAAAHKPGAVPLRPLRLGDMYDAAFRIIRFNPRATVGSAVLVAAAAMALPVLVTAVLSLTMDLSLGLTSSGTAMTPQGEPTDLGDALGILGVLGALVLGVLAQSLGLILVTGMVAHVTMAAAVGRRLSLGEAWRATHGARWRLVGLVVLVGPPPASSWASTSACGSSWCSPSASRWSSCSSVS